MLAGFGVEVIPLGSRSELTVRAEQLFFDLNEITVVSSSRFGFFNVNFAVVRMDALTEFGLGSSLVVPVDFRLR
jgi:hypothetical protein